MIAAIRLGDGAVGQALALGKTRWRGARIEGEPAPSWPIATIPSRPSIPPSPPPHPAAARRPGQAAGAMDLREVASCPSAQLLVLLSWARPTRPGPCPGGSRSRPRPVPYRPTRHAITSARLGLLSRPRRARGAARPRLVIVVEQIAQRSSNGGNRDMVAHTNVSKNQSYALGATGVEASGIGWMVASASERARERGLSGTARYRSPGPGTARTIVALKLRTFARSMLRVAPGVQGFAARIVRGRPAMTNKWWRGGRWMTRDD